MGVSSTTNRVVYAGDGSSTVFAFSYYFFAQADLGVYLYNTTTGSSALQVLNTNYTISGTANSQGVYPSGANVVYASSPASGYDIVIFRNPAQTQNFSLAQNGLIPSTALVQQFDYLTLLAQRLEDQASRTVALPDGLAGTFNPALPPDITLQANSVVVVNSSGNGWTFGVVNLVGSTASTFAGTMPIANGGTGIATAPTAGQVVYAQSATQYGYLTSGASGLPLLSGGSSAPSFAQLSLTSGVTGVLPEANGGTAASSFAGGKALYSGSSAITESVVTVTEQSYLSGVNSALQTQINAKAPTLNPTFTGTSVTLSNGTSLALTGSSGNIVQFKPATSGSSYILTMPVNHGGSNTVLTDDGTGALSFNTVASLSGALSVTTKTASYNATTSDDVVLCNSGAMTINLYGVSGNTGRHIIVKKIDSGTGTVTIAGSSASIDGSSVLLTTQYESVNMVCDGSNWQVSDRRIPSNWVAFTPTSTFSTNTVHSGFWRRIGDSMEIQYFLLFQGAPTSTTLTLNMPNLNSIDTAKTPPNGGNICGYGSIWDNGVLIYDLAVGYSSGSVLNPYVKLASGTTASMTSITQASPFTIGSSDLLVAWVRLPILGWQG